MAARGSFILVFGAAAHPVFDVVVNDEIQLSPGDCWMVPGGAEHEATALEDSVFVDVFSPPREEYR